MLPFQYQKADDLHSLLAHVPASDAPSPTAATAQFIAGGTNMADYMRLGVNRPDWLIDLNHLKESDLRVIDIPDGEIRLGALVRMSEVEDHEELNRRCPMLVDSVKLAASRQIRNMASLAGNILQRTRCEYFRETSWACNRREPGAGCAAMEGVTHQHAVLGTSSACIATYHGDFAQALIALDTEIDIVGRAGVRRVPFAELHRLPGDRPDLETRLQPGEVITAIRLNIPTWTKRSCYLKIRDRQSYAFALASVALALDLDGKKVRDVRMALGGVATVPWRARTAEDVLRGNDLTEEAAARAAEAAFRDAKPHGDNVFKIELGKRTVVRALMELRDKGIEP